MNAQNTNSESLPERVSQYARRIALTTRGKVLLVVALIISVASIPLLTRAEPSQDNIGMERHRLEGSWISTVSPILPPGVPPRIALTYVTFTAGGASIGSDRTKPFASPQHGTWVHVRGHEYAWTFVQDLFDSAGNFLGVFKGRALTELIGENEMVGVADVETRDPSGALQRNVCARFHAVRVVVEPLASPCENLEPGL